MLNSPAHLFRVSTIFSPRADKWNMNSRSNVVICGMCGSYSKAGRYSVLETAVSPKLTTFSWDDTRLGKCCVNSLSNFVFTTLFVFKVSCDIISLLNIGNELP